MSTKPQATGGNNTPRGSTRTPREVTAEILSRLDVAAEFSALGVRVSGTPRASGMVSCYAWGRDDRKPSAWINIRSGYYGDSGGADAPAFTCSLFDLAVRAGKFADWQEARKAYAEKVSVAIGKERRAPGGGGGRGKDKTDWREKLEFQEWTAPGNEILLLRWCAEFKKGTTPESVKAAGGRLAYWPCWIDRKTGEKRRTRDCHQVIAIPCYGSWLLDADPVAWVLWDVLGREFDVTPRDLPPTEPRVLAKMISVGPTAGAVMGLSSLMLLCDSERRGQVELAWKTEGPADLLSLWAAVPEAEREKVAIITAAGGATADVHPHQPKLLAGLPVAVVPDCDQAGVVGAEKWCRALHGIARDVRVVRLPWEIEPKSGRDVRDYLTTESRGYGDLLGLYQAAEAWKPAPAGGAGGAGATTGTPGAPGAPGEPNAPGAPTAAIATDAALDYYTDEQIAEALKIDVLGQRDDGDTIEVYSEHLRRTVTFKNVARLKYADLLRLFGTPVRRAVARGDDDVAPGMHGIGDVREAIAHLSSRCRLSDETKLGVGCWPADGDAGGGDGGQPSSIVLVNSSEAMDYCRDCASTSTSAAGDATIAVITHPRHKGQLLSFESGAKPWYEFVHLSHLLEQASDPTFRGEAIKDLGDLFARWRWSRQTHDPLLATGLVLATWVQTIWPWRPRIDVLGSTNTGKSMLCKALAGLYGELAIFTSDTTAAGLRQKICNSAAVVIVDEVDAKNRAKMARQREILEMLRSASRGTSAIRGTGSGKAVEFTLRHLVWVAGISLSYDDQADRNRAIRLDLQPPPKELAGKLRLPDPAELHDLGQRSLAVALWCAVAARKLAGELKDQKIEGVDQRAVESFAVPAAMLATAIDWPGMDAAKMLSEMAAGVRDDPQQMESDEANLMQDILGATVIIDGQNRPTVAQAIEYITTLANTNRDRWRQDLEAAGVKITLGANRTIGMSYQLVRRKLLYGTRWQEQPIEQYLQRIDGRVLKTIRCGGHRSRAVVFDLDWFVDQYLGEEETIEMFGTDGF